MGYCIYGKRIKPVRYYSPLGSHLEGPDSMFRALDAEGHRVNTLSKAAIYETKEQALSIIKNYQNDGILLEVRKMS